MAYDVSVLAKSDTDRRAPKLANILAKLVGYSASQNIAADLEQEELDKIGYNAEREYKIDKNSRADWEASATKAMDVALQVRSPKNYPFPNAANIKYPLVTVAALQFGARAYPAIIDGNRVVKCQVVGSDKGVMATDPQTGQPMPMMGPDGQPVLGPDGQMQPQWQIPPGAKKQKADRISEHMSYQLLTEMEEWEEDTDVLLHHLPIIGCAFRKVWRSEELGRNKSEMIPAIHLVVNNKVRNLNEAPRITHEIFLYPQDIEERKGTGTFLDVELPNPDDAGDDDDAPHMFLEQHRYLDLDGDGFREPYIVTVHEQSCKVVRIVANFRMEDVKYTDKRVIRIPRSQYFVKYSFIPDPKGGFYDIGFGRLLESLSETIDTTINQMLDAGHLQTAGGGFIGSGIRLKKKEIVRSPGKYEVIQTSGKIGDQIFTHQDAGPSAVLFNLLGMMIEAARDITAVKDILTGDTGNKGVQTATTTLALIEQGLKVFTAIYKRVYRSMKVELKLLFQLNAEHLDDNTYFNVMDEEKVVAKADYDLKSMDVMPVADPKMVTDMQRAAQSQVVMAVSADPVLGSQQKPREALKLIYQNAGMPDYENLLMPEAQGPSPQELLAIEDAKSKIEAAKAGATLSLAQAKKVEAETLVVPDAAEHAALMSENDKVLTRSKLDLDHGKLSIEDKRLAHEKECAEREDKRQREEADKQDKLERDKLSQADKHHGKELDHKKTETKAKTDEAGADRDLKRDQAELPKRNVVEKITQQMSQHGDQLSLALESTKQALEKSKQELAALAAEINSPVEVAARDKSGRIHKVKKGNRILTVNRDGEGRPLGLQ